MSRLRHKLYSMGVGAEALSVVEVASQQLLTSLPLAEYLPGASSAVVADWAPAFDAALAQAEIPARSDVTLTVSDAWTRYFIFEVPAGVSGLAELHMLAGARFESLYSVTPEGWHLEANWKPAGRILVCAMPERLLQVANDLGTGSTRQVSSIQPHALRLIHASHREIPDNCWLCCFASQGLVAMRVVGGDVRHVRRFPFAQTPVGHALSTLLKGESLRCGLDMPTTLCVLGMQPEMSQGGRVGGMQVVYGPKRLQVSAAQSVESIHLAMLGAAA